MALSMCLHFFLVPFQWGGVMGAIQPPYKDLDPFIFLAYHDHHFRPKERSGFPPQCVPLSHVTQVDFACSSGLTMRIPAPIEALRRSRIASPADSITQTRWVTRVATARETCSGCAQERECCMQRCLSLNRTRTRLSSVRFLSAHCDLSSILHTSHLPR